MNSIGLTKHKIMKTALILWLVLAVAGIAQANFVTNGDFATGDLTDWWAPGAEVQLSSYDTTGEGYVAVIPPSGVFQQQTSAVVEFEGQQFLLTADVTRIDYEPYHDYTVTMGAIVTTPGPVYNHLEYTTYGPEDLPLGVPTQVSVVCTATAVTVGYNIYFDVTGTNYGNMDNVQVTLVPSDTAQNPDPYNNEDFVSFVRELSWTRPNSFAPSGYDVYLGTNESLVTAGDISVRVSEGQSETIYNPNLLHDSEYFWRVDAIDPTGGTPVTYVGDTWSFTTSVALRGTVDKSGQTRTFNLEKYSLRGPNFGLVLLDTDGVTQIPLDPGPVRTYRGWCEEEPESYVEATLLSNGDLRYHVFNGDVTDWWYDPPFESNENAAAVNNFTAIGGTPVQPSGTAYSGASFTAPAGGLGNIWKSTYQADVGFDLLLEYVNTFNYTDLADYGRKAENAIGHYNGSYVRDALLETQLGKVVIRLSNAGLDREQVPQGVDWGYLNTHWNALFPNDYHHFIGMVGWIGGGVGFVCDYSSGWSGRSLNGWSGDGNFWVVARHEMGHNMGSMDCVGEDYEYVCPGPDGETIMSGNDVWLNRFGSPEVDQIMNCRNSGGRTSVLRDIGNFSYPMPPYAKYDGIKNVFAGEAEFLDVLANDYDANGDQIAISSFDATTTLGGTVDLVAEAGPDGRDLLIYYPSTAGTDTFHYSIVDSSGRVGRGNVKVTVVNSPPSWDSYPVVKPSATKGLNYNQTLVTDASDPDVGQALTFSLISDPSWLTVAADGQLSGVAGVGDVGPNVFTVRVTDNHGLYDETTMNIEVIEVLSLPPVWNSDPVFKSPGTEGMAYSGTLAADVSDYDIDDTLTFSLVPVSAWLNVSPEGQLSGIPADDDTGPNEFTVRATDNHGLYDEAALNIYVIGRFTGELGLSDLAEFVAQWLNTNCSSCGGTDLDGDGDNDMNDWAIFSGYWLK